MNGSRLDGFWDIIHVSWEKWLQQSKARTAFASIMLLNWPTNPSLGSWTSHIQTKSYNYISWNNNNNNNNLPSIAKISKFCLSSVQNIKLSWRTQQNKWIDPVLESSSHLHFVCSCVILAMKRFNTSVELDFSPYLLGSPTMELYLLRPASSKRENNGPFMQYVLDMDLYGFFWYFSSVPLWGYIIGERPLLSCKNSPQPRIFHRHRQLDLNVEAIWIKKKEAAAAAR